MIEDIQENYVFPSVRYHQVVDLLGVPERNNWFEKYQIKYPLSSKIGSDLIDPEYTLYFIITINQDSIVTNTKVEKR